MVIRAFEKFQPNTSSTLRTINCNSITRYSDRIRKPSPKKKCDNFHSDCDGISNSKRFLNNRHNKYKFISGERSKNGTRRNPKYNLGYKTENFIYRKRTIKPETFAKLKNPSSIYTIFVTHRSNLLHVRTSKYKQNNNKYIRFLVYYSSPLIVKKQAEN